MASGWPGNADALNLAVAGVKNERGYVDVDDYLRTSAPHIFAAGDINGRMMLVQSAGYEARIAAENAVLGAGQPYTHQIVPHGGFTDPEYASVGLTEDQARADEPECLVAVAPYADLDRAVHEGVEVAQLVEQLFGYFRDCMAAVAGCPAETLLYASPSRKEEVDRVGERLGLETVLAAMQILDHTLGRLRLST